MTIPRPAAFDAFAGSYDQTFTHSTLGRLLRPRVWRILHEAFAPGSHVLELACGTGLDAVWLAQHGIRVTATDGSPAMVDATRVHVAAAGVGELVTTYCQSFQEFTAQRWPADTAFDGAFSNFGGVNTLGDWSALARSLAVRLRPGARLILVPMGPLCPWEFFWHLAHGDAATALRRWRQPAAARIGEQIIPVWYPDLRRLKRAFSPWFRHLRTQSLGLWLPPSYLGHLVERHPTFFSKLNRIESAASHLTGGWGDHYIASFERSLEVPGE